MGQEHLTKTHREIMERLPGKHPSGALPIFLATARRPFPGNTSETSTRTANMTRTPRKGEPTGVHQKIKMPEKDRRFLPPMLRKNRPRKTFGYKTTVEKMKEGGLLFVSTFV